jgi:signal transduction histidine kinase/CheY-like chemotaxis protein
MEYRLQHHSGEHRWLVEAGRPLYGADGEFLGYIAAALDVSEQRQLEERLRQAQRMEAVGRLSGGIAHDFNNLLGVVRGTAELLLLDVSEGDPLREDLVEIDRAATRAAELTHRLLAFSRQQVLQPRVVNLNQVVRGMEKMLRRILGSDIQFLTLLEPLLGHTRVDPVQMEQILLNLAINARDAMPQGGTLITQTRNVELSEEYVAQFPYPVQAGPYILLSVADSGHGMSNDVRSRVFEPFFTTKETGKGTGLGLSTVYGIVKQSGGYIWVHSEVDQGARFEIYLPVVNGEASAALATYIETVSQPRGQTILLVENEASLRSVARRSLERAGYEVLEAEGGEVALALLAEHAADLLFTDVTMPRMGGRELSERARALCPGLHVLYTSGYTDETAVRHQVGRANAAFLAKPYGPEALIRAVSGILAAT